MVQTTFNIYKIYYIIKTQVNQRLRFTTVKLQFINGGDLSAQDIDRHDSTWCALDVLSQHVKESGKEKTNFRK